MRHKFLFLLQCCCIVSLHGDPLKGVLRRQYEHHCQQESDIYQHMPRLKELAQECCSVVEIGVRSMVSSWALLQGLSESSAASRSYLGIDLVSPPQGTLSLAKVLAQDHGIQFTFWEMNDMDVDLPHADMLFIDSLHTYCHLSYELEKFSPRISKYIAMHDTSSPWGDQDDPEYSGDYSEYPSFINRKKKGLWSAVIDFLRRHPEWTLWERHCNNHGFTILKRI